MAFANNLFISYSRADAEWAQKLYQLLASNNTTVYLDTEHLKGGELWEQSLTKQVNDSAGWWCCDRRRRRPPTG